MKFIILLLVLSLSACKDFSYIEKFNGITVKNNSGSRIYAYPCNSSSVFFYPDTLLPNIDIKPYLLESGHHIYWESKKEYDEQITDLPADTLSIFFFDAGMYEDSSWSVIRDNYLILDRYDLSIEDLQALDFIITYP